MTLDFNKQGRTQNQKPALHDSNPKREPILRIFHADRDKTQISELWIGKDAVNCAIWQKIQI